MLGFVLACVVVLAIDVVIYAFGFRRGTKQGWHVGYNDARRDAELGLIPTKKS